MRNVAAEESKGTLWRDPRGHFGADEQIFGFHIVRRPEEEFEGDKLIFGCGEQWRQDRCWVQLNLTCHIGSLVYLLPVFLKSAFFSGKKVQIGFHKSKERFWFLLEPRQLRDLNKNTHIVLKMRHFLFHRKMNVDTYLSKCGGRFELL